MKAVFLLAVLTVLVLLPQESDASWWRKAKEWVKKQWRKIKDKLRNKRGEVDDLDLNQDGMIDQAELEQMLGEREARDLMNIMNADDSLTMEDFKRNVRSLEELEDDE